MTFRNTLVHRRLVSSTAVLLALILIGLVFRVWNLAVRDVWFDEAFTGVALKQPLATMLATIKADVHPPLYYIIAKPIASAFQYSEVGIRLLSVVAGVLGIVMLFLFVRAYVSQRAALWSAALLAILPFAVQYSQEARMYTLFALCIVGSAFGFLRAVQQRSWRWAFLSGALVGLAALTHYLALLYIVLIPMAFLPQIFFSVQHTKALHMAARLIAAFLVGGGILFSPWLSTFIHHVHHTRNFTLQWITPATPHRAIETLQTFVLGTPQGRASQGIIGPNQFSAIAPWITATMVLVIVGVALFVVARTHRSVLWSLLILSFGQIVLLYLLSLFGIQYFVSRYMLPSAYFLCVVFGVALSTLRTSWATALVVGYLLLLPLRNTDAPLNDWGTLTKDLHSRPISHLYVLNLFDYMVAQYELGTDRVVLYNSEQPNEPVSGWAGIGPGLRQETQIENVVHDSAGAIVTYTPLPMSTFSFANTHFQLVRAYGHLLLYKSVPATDRQ